MEKYHTACWYCGGENMEVKVGYWQCKDCGATYNEPRLVAPPEIAPNVATVATKIGIVKVRGLHRTRSAMRRSAKARRLKGT